MMKILHAVLFWTLVLAACSSGALSPEPPAPTLDIPATVQIIASPVESPTTEIIPVSTTAVLPPAKLIATVSTPHIDQGPDGAVTEPTSSYPQGCGYQWAYQDMPELSADFLQSMQALQPKAQVRVYGFGEDCIHEDGTATFIPMETDFEITFPVDDLTDTTVLGEWIVKIMDVIDNIPTDQIVGPRPGRVGIMFESNGQRQGVSFYIDQYRALPAGLSNAEIYQALKSLQ
jgi:hypothetical protein